MSAYIINSKAISPQSSFNGIDWNCISPASRYMSAKEPNYKDFFPVLKLRRMSRIVKMGLTSATECLKESGIKNPGAIITSTGWGCLEDTFKFLNEIAEKKEQTLSPATFIQSTHNTVGGQIALMLNCQEYNSVYVNHTSSFEHGLLDALMLLNENVNNILIGGVDELTQMDFALKEKAGYWKEDDKFSHLPDCKSGGTLAGEGSVFFLLNSKPLNNCHSYVQDVRIRTEDNAKGILLELLHDNDLQITDIQVCISGINGDYNENKLYKDFLTKNFGNSVHCYYKHLCGQYDTSSAFALWLANEIIRKQIIPESIKVDPKQKVGNRIENILLYNYSEPNDHAFILVSKTGI